MGNQHNDRIFPSSKPSNNHKLNKKNTQLSTQNDCQFMKRRNVQQFNAQYFGQIILKNEKSKEFSKNNRFNKNNHEKASSSINDTKANELCPTHMKRSYTEKEPDSQVEKSQASSRISHKTQEQLDFLTKNANNGACYQLFYIEMMKFLDILKDFKFQQKWQNNLENMYLNACSKIEQKNVIEMFKLFFSSIQDVVASLIKHINKQIDKVYRKQVESKIGLLCDSLLQAKKQSQKTIKQLQIQKQIVKAQKNKKNSKTEELKQQIKQLEKNAQDNLKKYEELKNKLFQSSSLIRKKTYIDQQFQEVNNRSLNGNKIWIGSGSTLGNSYIQKV